MDMNMDGVDGNRLYTIVYAKHSLDQSRSVSMVFPRKLDLRGPFSSAW